MKLNFGKHKGQDIEDVPDSYLTWVLDNCPKLGETTTTAIKKKLGIINDEYQAQMRSQLAQAVIRAKIDARGEARDEAISALKTVYRTLSRKYHPDMGGDTAKMAAINEYHEQVTKALAQ